MDNNVLVTGGSGMLAKGFQFIHPEFSYLNKSEFNLLDKEQMEQIVLEYNPDYVINCAAYTKVDQAEKDPISAFETNGIGIYYLASLAKREDFRIINFSTDYVFPDNGPHSVNGCFKPLNTYGASKLVGEQILRWISPTSTTIRISWLFGPFGKNFVTTMMKLMKSNDEIKVVDDQIGSPTYTLDVVNFVISEILSKKEWKNQYHFSNTGETTWFGFAREIARLIGVNTEIIPVSSEEYPTIAKRPSNSVLSHNNNSRNWELALRDYIKYLRKLEQ